MGAHRSSHTCGCASFVMAIVSHTYGVGVCVGLTEVFHPFVPFQVLRSVLGRVWCALAARTVSIFGAASVGLPVPRSWPTTYRKAAIVVVRTPTEKPSSAQRKAPVTSATNAQRATI